MNKIAKVCVVLFLIFLMSTVARAEYAGDMFSDYETVTIYFDSLVENQTSYVSVTKFFYI